MPNLSDNLLKNLQKIQDTKTSETSISNVWATGKGISKTLKEILGKEAHIIEPTLSSIFSPASSNEQNKIQGARNYVEAINALLNKGVLDKPIVMIINTTPVSVSSSRDVSAIGGSHWVTCVILPKQYKTCLLYTSPSPRDA